MRLLKAEQVAEQWGLSVQRVYELSRKGEIPVVRLGDRQYRYSADELENFVKSGGRAEANQDEGSHDLAA